MQDLESRHRFDSCSLIPHQYTPVRTNTRLPKIYYGTFFAVDNPTSSFHSGFEFGKLRDSEHRDNQLEESMNHKMKLTAKNSESSMKVRRLEGYPSNIRILCHVCGLAKCRLERETNKRLNLQSHEVIPRTATPEPQSHT